MYYNLAIPTAGYFFLRTLHTFEFENAACGSASIDCNDRQDRRISKSELEEAIRQKLKRKTPGN